MKKKAADPSLRTESGQPIYMMLYERFRKDIIDGIYPFGTRFPSKRVIADRYSVSMITVEHTLSLLCDEGYLESRPRSGFFVSFNADDLFASSLDHPASIPISSRETEPPIPVPQWESDNPYPDFPFSPLAKTMRRVLSEQDAKILDRIPNNGLPELTGAIASYLARSRGIRVDTDQIIIGAGSEYLYSLIIQLLGRDKIYAIENPSYEKIELIYRANGARPELLTLGPDGIRSSALKNSQAEILHITPYRSYPSGISTNASKRREYIRWAKVRQGYIIEDDFESEFTLSSKPEETLFALSDAPNVLYLNSFSKTISPSIRTAYLLLPKPLVPDFQKKLGFYACTVPSFEQYVLADFIQSGEFERHLNRMRRKLRTQKGY